MTTVSKLIEYSQRFILGVVWVYAHLILVGTYVIFIGLMLYAFVYTPVSWAIRHMIGLFIS